MQGHSPHEVDSISHSILGYDKENYKSISSKISFYQALGQTKPIANRHASSPPTITSSLDSHQHRDCYFWGLNKGGNLVQNTKSVIKKAHKMKVL